MPLPNSHVLAGELAKHEPHVEEQERKRALLARVKANRDGIYLNRGKVTGDPTKEYVWVNVHADRQLWYQTQGFAVCKDPTLTTSIPQRDDGTYTRGDLVLYEIDKEYFSALHEYDVARGIEYVEGGIENEFSAAAMREGVPSFRPAI